MTRKGAQPDPVLRVVFYQADSGSEPVREWLLSLPPQDGKSIGRRIKTAQYGWPMGMPVVRLHEEVGKDAGCRVEDGQAPCRRDERAAVTENRHIGSDFDDFLRGQNLLEGAEAAAAKQVVAYQIAQEMRRTKVTKSEMAKRMKTSRPAVDRLLDPNNRSVTLSTLERAASAVGRKLRVELI
jgi:hypothetical protein